MDQLVEAGPFYRESLQMRAGSGEGLNSPADRAQPTAMLPAA